MKRRASIKKIQKITVFATLTVILAMTLFVIVEVAVIGISALRKEFTSKQALLKSYTSLAAKATGNKEEIKELLKREFGAGVTSFRSKEDLKNALLKSTRINLSGLLPGGQIKQKIKWAGLVITFALVLGCVAFLILEISKKIVGDERRRYIRYDAEAEIYFSVTYNMSTSVEFQLLDKKDQGKTLSEKYSAISRNFSVEGMCFTSGKKLEKGDILSLEIYVPSATEPIRMRGQVMWSHTTSLKEKGGEGFDTGVRLIIVNGKPVHQSIHFDKANKVTWSVVLESVFGNFRKLAQIRKSTRGKTI